MIGIDTNVLLRFLLADDTEQSPKARTLVAEYGGLPETLRLADVVLVELANLDNATPNGPAGMRKLRWFGSSPDPAPAWAD